MIEPYSITTIIESGDRVIKFSEPYIRLYGRFLACRVPILLPPRAVVDVSIIVVADSSIRVEEFVFRTGHEEFTVEAPPIIRPNLLQKLISVELSDKGSVGVGTQLKISRANVLDEIVYEISAKQKPFVRRDLMRGSKDVVR